MLRMHKEVRASAHLEAVGQVHAEEGGGDDADGERKRRHGDDEIDADYAVARRAQVHAPHLPEHLQVLSHLLCGKPRQPHSAILQL